MKQLSRGDDSKYSNWERKIIFIGINQQGIFIAILQGVIGSA